MSTEENSPFDELEAYSLAELVQAMHIHNNLLQPAMEKALPQIENLATAIYKTMRNGGRLFYLGAGTSGRLGVVDASECPPTFGVPQGLVIGIIAGGDTAMRKAVEFAEDNMEQAWKDLSDYNVSPNDFVVGISASGRTPYVLGALKEANQHQIQTGCIVCNYNSKIEENSKFPVSVVPGPEFVTGSTRLNAGTVTKLVLNMLTTSVMIKLGHVKGNKMVDMQLSNEKLIDRGVRMILEKTSWTYEAAKEQLLLQGSVRKAIEVWESGNRNE